MSTEPILEVNDLKRYFPAGDRSLLDVIKRTEREHVHAVDGVDLALGQQESVGVIGESGCGKTTLLKTIAGLLRPTDGEILFSGDPITEFSRTERKQYRQNVQIIFQDPFNSLDPKFTVRETIREPLVVHGFDDKEERIHDMLETVELQPTGSYIDKRPSQLSGGEKQRVSIARALVIEPSFILADEPVSMLDVSTQASILQLLSRLVDDLDVSLIYISHDLSTVSYVCERLHVMYLGRIIESGDIQEVIDDPKHPYSQALINAIPIPDPHQSRERTELEGAPSDPIGIDRGCRFRDRCPDRMNVCDVRPRKVRVDDQSVACHLYYDHQEDPERSDSRADREDGTAGMAVTETTPVANEVPEESTSKGGRQ